MGGREQGWEDRPPDATAPTPAAGKLERFCSAASRCADRAGSNVGGLSNAKHIKATSVGSTHTRTFHFVHTSLQGKA